MPGVAALALGTLILTACRSGEVRLARWAEFDREGATWTIPAVRMKAGREHRVPLTPAVLALLDRVQGLAPGGRADPAALVFPGLRGGALSDMTLAAVLKRMGRTGITVHGFRSSFRDWAEEATDFPHEVKESALAHTVKGKTAADYRRADLFAKRRALMLAWAGFVTGREAAVFRTEGGG